MDWDDEVTEACRNGNLEELKKLITHENVNTKLISRHYLPGEHLTAIETCAFCDWVSCVSWLAEDMGANIGNALVEACRFDGYKSAIYLIEHGANIHHIDEDRYPYQLLSAPVGYKVSQLLLEHKARADYVEFNGRTPLCRVISHFDNPCFPEEQDCKQTAKLLVRYGARVDNALKAHTVPKSPFTQRPLVVPYWLWEYQREVDIKRVNFTKAACTLFWVLRKKGMPKDLVIHMMKRMFVPCRWDDAWYNTSDNKRIC